jgi:transcriptional regulator of acetoin/glycerol metabolism
MHSPSHAPARRAVLLSDRSSAELSKALSSAGFEVRVGGNLCAPDVALADPLLLSAPGGCAVEELIALRAGELLSRLGDGAPGLHEAIMSQAEKGVFRAVLAHTKNHLGRASKILGLDRNTCARKARAFGLVDEPSRGRKPAPKRPSRAPRRGGKRPGKRVR